MGRKTKLKKTLEQQIAERRIQRARDLEAVNLPPELSDLPHGQDIEVSREGAARDGQRAARDLARRMDAYEALRGGMVPGAYDAARQLEHDMLLRRGEGDKGRSFERVDGGERKDRTDCQIAAAKAVEKALASIGPRDAMLLHEINQPSRPFATWREIVAYVTGEENEHAQASAVRSACANLAPHYNGRKAA